MIPKKIYYFWQHEKSLTPLANKCIASWKKFLPEYEIIQIDETNFDVNQCDYAKVAWEAKRYAYLSDYARVKVLYENGGLYFDLDVEIINDIHDIIDKGPFFGISKAGDNKYSIATGLGFAVEKQNILLKKLVQLYENWKGDKFYDERNFPILPACPTFNDIVFKDFGFESKNEIQVINGITFYPTEFFEPVSFLDRKLYITPKTKSIHWYNDKNDYIKGDAFVYKYRAKLCRKFNREPTEKEFNFYFRVFHPIHALIFHKSHKTKKQCYK